MPLLNASSHSSFEMICIKDGHFQTNSEMIPTGGNYLLFTSLNDIQLLINININITLTIEQYSILTIGPCFPNNMVVQNSGTVSLESNMRWAILGICAD